MAIFNMMKDQASKVKMAMQEENMRFMALHGQVLEPLHSYIYAFIQSHTCIHLFIHTYIGVGVGPEEGRGWTRRLGQHFH